MNLGEHMQHTPTFMENAIGDAITVMQVNKKKIPGLPKMPFLVIDFG